jgi:hypothetical protein
MRRSFRISCNLKITQYFENFALDWGVLGRLDDKSQRRRRYSVEKLVPRAVDPVEEY